MHKIVAGWPVKGGFYEVTYFARDPMYKPQRRVFLHFLDTFRPWSAKIDYVATCLSRPSVRRPALRRG